MTKLSTYEAEECAQGVLNLVRAVKVADKLGVDPGVLLDCAQQLVDRLFDAVVTLQASAAQDERMRGAR